MTENSAACNLCGADLVEDLGPVGLRPVSVTSEPQAVDLPARVLLCRRCGHLQKKHTPEAAARIAAMYAAYTGHHLSGGGEQLVFPPDLPPRARNYYALAKCLPDLPGRGRLLDFGCGNGTVLKSAGQLLPNWNLVGFDVADTQAAVVRSLPGVTEFYSGSLDNLPEDDRFDLIVAWHVLEHVNQPLAILQALKRRLAPGGSLLLSMPDVHRTPFDLSVIDHCSHFTQATLLHLTGLAGFAPIRDGTDWMHNSLTYLLRPAEEQPRQTPTATPGTEARQIFDWLNAAVRRFDEATARPYALFGTGNASIWLFGQLSHPPACFLDEDATRIGRHFHEVVIRSPAEAPTGLDIVMPFRRETGSALGAHLRETYAACRACTFILSPD